MKDNFAFCKKNIVFSLDYMQQSAIALLLGQETGLVFSAPPLVWCSMKVPIDLDFRQRHKYSYCCISAMIPDSKSTQRAVEFCEMFDRKRLKGHFWEQFLVVNVFGRAIPKFPCVIALLMIQNTFPDVCIFILGVKLCILFERLIMGKGKRKPIQRIFFHFS